MAVTATYVPMRKDEKIGDIDYLCLMDQSGCKKIFSKDSIKAGISNKQLIVTNLTLGKDNSLRLAGEKKDEAQSVKGGLVGTLDVGYDQYLRTTKHRITLIMTTKRDLLNTIKRERIEATLNELSEENKGMTPDRMKLALLDHGFKGNADTAFKGVRDLKVVGSYIFTDRGSLIEVEKAVGKRGEPGYIPHKVAATGKVVGWKVKNISNHPISIIKSLVTRGTDGKPSWKIVEYRLNPNDETPLRIADFMANMAQVTYCMQFANGQCRELVNSEDVDTDEKIVENYTVLTNDGAGKNQIQVGRKIAEDQWEVAPEYAEYFGYDTMRILKKRKENVKKDTRDLRQKQFLDRLLANE